MKLLTKSTNRFIRPCVKYFEQLPLPAKKKFIAFVGLLLPVRTLREKSRMKMLSDQKIAPAFYFSRDIGAQEVFLDAQITADAIRFAQSKLEEFKSLNLERKNSKSYLQQIFNISDINKESQFLLDFATSIPILKAVGKYLGAYPILHDVSVFYSPATVPRLDSPYTGSQLFHMDGDGAQNVKLWLLCDRVNQDNGPTVLIPASESAQVAKYISYRPGDKINDSLLGTALARAISATGAAGTWFATDTDRCFHYGSRTTTNSERLVIMFHYVDQNSSYYLPIFKIYYGKIRTKVRASLLETNGDFARTSLRHRIERNS